MPYLPVDLDAKRKAHGIERALGLPRHAVAGGLTDLWEVVWRDKSDVVDDLTLDEAFGPDPRIRAALVARGFIEPADKSGHRVRGAAKWLFGLEGKSRGGKAAKANLIPGPKAKSAEDPKPIPSASAEDQPKPPFGSPSALSPSTQHPAPKEILKSFAGEPPPAPAPKEKTRLKVLTELLVADYSAMRPDAKYLHQGARDTVALKRLCAAEGDDEVIRGRWRYGLRRNDWLGVNTFAQLALKFNDLAGFSAPLPGASPPRPAVRPKPVPAQPLAAQEEIPW